MPEPLKKARQQKGTRRVTSGEGLSQARGQYGFDIPGESRKEYREWKSKHELLKELALRLGQSLYGARLRKEIFPTPPFLKGRAVTDEEITRWLTPSVIREFMSNPFVTGTMPRVPENKLERKLLQLYRWRSI